ncbi:hypothetical protein, partial [Enterococcus faecium]
DLPYRAMIPSYGRRSPCSFIGVNGKHLGDAQRAVQIIANSTAIHALRLMFGGELDPIRIDTPAPLGVTIVIGPYRVDAPTA